MWMTLLRSLRLLATIFYQGVAPEEPDNIGIRNILILRYCKNDLAPTELNLIGNFTALGLRSCGALQPIFNPDLNLRLLQSPTTTN